MRNPTFRPLISQFINYAEFQSPKESRYSTVSAPEDADNNVSGGKALFQIMTKLNRN